MCWYRRKSILTGVIVIVFIVVYLQIMGTKWGDVCIIHYDGKILADQEFDPALCKGAEILRPGKRKVRAYYEYFPGNRAVKKPEVKADLNDKIRIHYEEMINGERVEQWKLVGGLDSDMKDVVSGGSKVIEGTSYRVNGWVVEWWRYPKKPVKVIIITNPKGKSRTFKIQWYPK